MIHYNSFPAIMKLSIVVWTSHGMTNAPRSLEGREGARKLFGEVLRSEQNQPDKFTKRWSERNLKKKESMHKKNTSRNKKNNEKKKLLTHETSLCFFCCCLTSFITYIHCSFFSRHVGFSFLSGYLDQPTRRQRRPGPAWTLVATAMDNEVVGNRNMDHARCASYGSCCHRTVVIFSSSTTASTFTPTVITRRRKRRRVAQQEAAEDEGRTDRRIGGRGHRRGERVAMK